MPTGDRLRAGLRTLHPGSFAFVMATGIVAEAAGLVGPAAATWPLVVAAGAGYTVLCVLFLLRAARFPADVWADFARPERAFGFFTFVAGSNVLASEPALSGWDAAVLPLAAAGAAAWLVLTYLVPFRVALAAGKPEPGLAVNGTWLVWVVGTQSVAITVALLGERAGLPARVAALSAVSLWAFGALLYLVLIGIILARLMLLRLDPVEAAPPYWISMGATAITVLAGGHLLLLPAGLPSLAAARPTIEGFTLFLWAFGTWWFPFLLLLTGWRYLRLQSRVYEQTLWSMVFPLGMYAVATDTYGRAAGLPLLPGIARAEVGLALVAWLGVAAWMVTSWFRPPAREDAETFTLQTS